MKILHEYYNNWVHVYPEPEFMLEELQRYKEDFEKNPRPNQNVLLVDDNYKIKGRGVVLYDKHGKQRIITQEGHVLIRGKDGLYVQNRKELLKQAIDAIIQRKYGNNEPERRK